MDVLSKPVNNILNRLFHELGLPASWKMANVTPLSKQKPVLDINLHLRPISLMSILSKLAEEVIVERYVKPAILKIVANVSLELFLDHQLPKPLLALFICFQAPWTAMVL